MYLPFSAANFARCRAYVKNAVNITTALLPVPVPVPVPVLLSALVSSTQGTLGSATTSGLLLRFRPKHNLPEMLKGSKLSAETLCAEFIKIFSLN